MHDYFESDATCMLPVDPYSKQKWTNNRSNPHISDTNTLRNKSQSKTGVDLRWHKKSEYQRLNKEQRSELYEWKISNKDKVTKQKKDHGFQPTFSAKKKLRSEVVTLRAKLKDHELDPTLE